MRISDIEIDLNEINTVEGRDKAARAIAANIGPAAEGSEKVREKLMSMLEGLASNGSTEVLLEKAATYLEKVSGRLSEMSAMFLDLAQTQDHPPVIFDLGQWQGGIIFASGICNVTASAIREQLKSLKAEKAKGSETPTEVPPPPDHQPAQQESMPS